MSYISSNNNRFYVAPEQSYGKAGSITSTNRIPAIKLTTRQRSEKVQRRDKSGSRTFLGNPSGLRKETTFELRTYMTNWADQTALPACWPLFQACLGGGAMQSAGGAVAQASTSGNVVFAAPHGLAPGQALTSGGEIRFAAAIVDNQTVQLNAPFSAPLNIGAQTGPTAAIQPATDLSSVTIFDYWSPGSAVQRILSGAAVDSFTVAVNGDFHEFVFAGQAQDLLDSSSFVSGQAQVSAFPAEPSVGGINYQIVPGHLGQVWLGSTPDQFFTLTKAKITFQNNLDLRTREFGASLPLAIAPGERTVTVDFSIYQQDDAATAALYQAARQRSPVSMMLQLGQQAGQLFGIYMKSVIPEVPEFDDSDKRQQWQFQSCRAQGSVNDELFVAFG
ncbi:MAG TPA: hypothetical protein VKX49_28805 [Bryobacteraceae bacterium]|nr:hypothetical protein [Bryobacteraceae bacterium]